MKPFLTIDCSSINTLNSPVGYLSRYVGKALSLLPKIIREGYFATGKKLTLKFVESTGFICGISKNNPEEILVSSRVLELIWCVSYLNVTYYTLLYDRDGLRKPIAIDLSKERELTPAIQLFDWCFNAWKNPSLPQIWPDGLPKPSETSRAPALDGMADEISVLALCYLVLHEIEHVVQEHGPNDTSGWSIEQEQDADREAVGKFLAAYPDSTQNERIKREIAVATALIIQVADAMFTGEWGGKSHPLKWQRLDQVIRSTEDDEEHPVYAFVAHLLPLYRAISGGGFASGGLTSFLQGFDSYIDEISRIKTNSNDKAFEEPSK